MISDLPHNLLALSFIGKYAAHRIYSSITEAAHIETSEWTIFSEINVNLSLTEHKHVKEQEQHKHKHLLEQCVHVLLFLHYVRKVELGCGKCCEFLRGENMCRESSEPDQVPRTGRCDGVSVSKALSDRLCFIRAYSEGLLWVEGLLRN